MAVDCHFCGSPTPGTQAQVRGRTALTNRGRTGSGESPRMIKKRTNKRINKDDPAGIIHKGDKPSSGAPNGEEAPPVLIVRALGEGCPATFRETLNSPGPVSVTQWHLHLPRRNQRSLHSPRELPRLDNGSSVLPAVMFRHLQEKQKAFLALAALSDSV